MSDDTLIEAVRSGDAQTLTALLDERPDALRMRIAPYDSSLLHVAAQAGQSAVVALLIARGLDVDIRETGDNTTALHWAAAGGYLDVVRQLAQAGGDVVGHGDDHQLDVIGWATCWQNFHADVAEYLVSRGARHHIFSAIALNLATEVRAIVAANPAALHSRLTRHDSHRTPLHHAILCHRPAMVTLLLELGADPLAADAAGVQVGLCATTSDGDRALMVRLREMTFAELRSASRGQRQPQSALIDFVAALALGDSHTATRLLDGARTPFARDGPAAGALHVMAKRGDTAAVTWLLEVGADPNERWGHWDAEVTPIHLAAAHGHADVVRQLLAAGADPSIRDSKYNGDAIGWAEYGRAPSAPQWRAIVEILKAHVGE